MRWSLPSGGARTGPVADDDGLHAGSGTAPPRDAG
jgi:hypothetical protein